MSKVLQQMVTACRVRPLSLATRLSTRATGLDGQLLTSLLQVGNSIGGPSGQVNVHGGTHSGSKVGWAGVQVAELKDKKCCN